VAKFVAKCPVCGQILRTKVATKTSKKGQKRHFLSDKKSKKGCFWGILGFCGQMPTFFLYFSEKVKNITIVYKNIILND